MLHEILLDMCNLALVAFLLTVQVPGYHWKANLHPGFDLLIPVISLHVSQIL